VITPQNYGLLSYSEAPTVILQDGSHNGFGGLCITAEGDLLAAWRVSSAHVPPPGGTPGYIQTAKSTDGGATWSTPVTILSAPANEDYRGASLTTLANGDILLRTVLTDTTAPAGDQWSTFLMRSTDNGATWGAPYEVNSSTIPHPASESPVLQLGNGDCLMAIYGYQFDGPTRDTWWSSSVMRSTDNGASWSDLAVIADGQTASQHYVEPYLTLLNNGDVLCMIRRDDNSTEVSARSTNSGATWGTTRQVFANATGRPSTIQLANGALLTTHRVGSTGNAAFSVSWTGGVSWEPTAVFDTGFRSAYAELIQVAPNVVGCLWSMEPNHPATGADLKFMYFFTAENYDPLA
jgi:Neuraminidase (sialidase)